MNFLREIFSQMSEETPVPGTLHDTKSTGVGCFSKVANRNPGDSIFEVRDILSRERRLIAVVTLLFTLGSVFYAFFATPVYRSTTLVDVSADKDRQASAFLQSHAFFEDFVRREELLPLLYADLQRREPGIWKGGGKQAPSLRDGAALLKRRVAVSRKKKNSGLVRVSLEFEDPSVAADILNRLVVRINEVIREEAVVKATRNISYLEEQLRLQDSLLVAWLASPAILSSDDLLKKDVTEEMQWGIDHLQVQMMLVDGSLERRQLIDMIQKNSRTIMRARTEADEFALKVYDPASPNEKEIRPEKKSVILLGFVGGLFSAVFLAFSREFFVGKKSFPDSVT